MQFAAYAQVHDLDAALPQTQCTRCGYAGCLPYAAAMAEGAADVNRCPPGGDPLVGVLAAMLHRPPVPLDRMRGEPGPLLVAVIDEAACIGCTLCIDACPVDAIAGAPKRMHVVLPSLCSGCELCVDPCPVDCIAMAVAGREWTHDDAVAARSRHERHNQRVAEHERIASRRPPRASDAKRVERQSAVAAALARARARRVRASGG